MIADAHIGFDSHSVEVAILGDECDKGLGIGSNDHVQVLEIPVLEIGLVQVGGDVQGPSLLFFFDFVAIEE